MEPVSIRYQEIEDAERFFEILNNDNFVFWHVRPDSLEAEIDFLKGNKQRREKNVSWNYTILYDGAVVGGIGIKINQHRPHIGEIGYFVDEAYWGKGIASKAVALIEKEAENIGLNRLEIVMHPKNTASERIAIKNGYTKEGVLKGFIKKPNGELLDCFLYSKIVYN